jgi:hypothetical protein
LLFQLPNGKAIEISTEQFVEMTDEELEYLIAFNYGDIQENPWFGSILSSGASSIIDDIDDIIPVDLTQISDEDKINFSDIDYKIEEE